MPSPVINAVEALVAILVGLLAIEEFVRDQIRKGQDLLRQRDKDHGGSGVETIKNPRKPNPLIPISIMLLIIDLTIFLLGTFVFQWNFSTCYPFAPASATITSPASGSQQPLLITVEGTACHIPSDKQLWLLVVPGGVQGYYPQNGPIVVSSTGAWSASAMDLLGQRDV